MQQFTPISVLPATSPGVSAPASGAVGVQVEGGSQAMAGNGFGKVFQSVSADSEGPVVNGQAMSWESFKQQYPELMEQLGEEFDIEAFFAQFQFDGQSFSFDATSAGEFLPPGLEEQAGGVLGQMTAWFKQSGIELTLDDSGQIVPVDFTASEVDPGLSFTELDGDTQGLMEKITSAINQFVGSLQSASNEDSPTQVLQTGVNGIQGAQGLTLGVQKVVDPVVAAVNPAANAPNVSTALNTTASPSEGAASMGSAHEAVSSQLSNQQGFSNQGGGQQGQSETDAQFKAFLNGQPLDGATDEVGDLLQPKTVENASPKFAEIQSKIQGAVLKQYSTGVSTPVQDPAWADQMSQKIVWMTGRNIQSAEIHLNPAELGPVEVRISVQNEQAAITFNAQHATVRELLESNVTRLREMMDANGVELADVDVSSGEGQEQYAAEGDQESAEGSDEQMAGSSQSVEGDVEKVSVQESGVGLVDYYA